MQSAEEKNLLTGIDSVGLIRLKLQESMRINPRYSLRAFAKKLGITPGGLSQILARKKRLSLSRAHEVAQRLELSEIEKEHFLLLVQLETAKSTQSKALIYEKIKLNTPSGAPAFNLSLEHFRMISDWYGLAILEMITHFAGNWPAVKIAEFLTIPKVDVEVMLERLVRLELIEKTKTGYARCCDRLLVHSATHSEAIRNYYHGVYARADQSVDTQTAQEKVAGAEVFAFDPSQLEEVKKMNDAFLDSLLKLARQGKQRTEIYQVVTNIFRLNPKPKRKSKS